MQQVFYDPSVLEMLRRFVQPGLIVVICSPGVFCIVLIRMFIMNLKYGILCALFLSLGSVAQAAEPEFEGSWYSDWENSVDIKKVKDREYSMEFFAVLGDNLISKCRGEAIYDPDKLRLLPDGLYKCSIQEVINDGDLESAKEIKDYTYQGASIYFYMDDAKKLVLKGLKCVNECKVIYERNKE